MKTKFVAHIAIVLEHHKDDRITKRAVAELLKKTLEDGAAKNVVQKVVVRAIDAD